MNMLNSHQCFYAHQTTVKILMNVPAVLIELFCTVLAENFNIARKLMMWEFMSLIY